MTGRKVRWWFVWFACATIPIVLFAQLGKKPDRWTCVETLVVERTCETLEKVGDDIKIGKEPCPLEVCTRIIKYSSDINLQ